MQTCGQNRPSRGLNFQLVRTHYAKLYFVMEGNTSNGSSGGGAEISAAASGAAEVAAGMEEECPEGMQKNPGRGALWVKPEKALEVMKEQKRKGKATFRRDFQPVIAEKGGERLCWLQCTKQVCVWATAEHPEPRQVSQRPLQAKSMQGGKAGAGAGIVECSAVAG